MVRIINYKERETDDGRSFFVLELQGGLEMVKSQDTGKYYATIRKASVPTTFDEATCKAFIGTEMPGNIEKELCDPYEYTVQETGEVIDLSHRYTYVADDAKLEIVEQPLKADTSVFSENGILEPSM